MTPNDPEALAASINRLIESPEMMHKFSQNALSKARTFEVGALAKKLLGVYQQAIQDKADQQFVGIDE